MNELEKKLAEIRNKMRGLTGRDLNEEETNELSDLNKQASALKARIQAEEELEVAKQEESARIEREKKEAVDAAVKAEAAKHRRPAGGDVPYQAQFSGTWKYDTLDATELSLLIETEHALGIEVSPEAYKAMSLRVAEMKDDNTEEGRKSLAYVRNAFKRQTATNIDPNLQAIEAAIKAATDPMYTGGSGIGSDWVGTAYSTEIWRKIRAACFVAAKVPSDTIPDGYSSKVWPLESTDLTWYKVAEATTSDSTLKVPAATTPASQIATGSKTLSVAKVGARGLYTGELEEDSLIRFVAQLRTQLEESGVEILEHLFIDGDVETSANKNINDIAGTPDAADVFLVFDGFRKLALVTNTANSRSASGGLIIEDYVRTLKLMGTAGLAGSDPSKVSFIVDGNVHYANMELSEVKTKDVHNRATIENGFLKAAYGVDIIPSWQMHRGSTVRKAQTDGKIDLDTTADNTTGSILSVRWDQWKQAWKRRMTLETTRIARADSWEIVALMRGGLAYRDDEAAAISYNVGV